MRAHQLARATCLLDQSIQERYRIQRSGPDPEGYRTHMAINVKPLGDRVLVQPLEEKEVKKGDIIIPDTAKEKPQAGPGAAVGTGKLDDNGKKIEFTVKVGDKVLISKYGGTEIKIDVRTSLIMREDDILGIIG